MLIFFYKRLSIVYWLYYLSGVRGEADIGEEVEIILLLRVCYDFFLKFPGYVGSQSL